MKLQVGVKTLIRHPDGSRYFFFKKSGYIKLTRGLWDIPGGRITVGTKLEDNLEREVFEETGFTISQARLLTAQDIITATRTRHVVRLTYLTELGSGTDIPVLNFEHTHYTWSTLDEIVREPDLDTYIRDAIAHLPLQG